MLRSHLPSTVDEPPWRIGEDRRELMTGGKPSEVFGGRSLPLAHISGLRGKARLEQVTIAFSEAELECPTPLRRRGARGQGESDGSLTRSQCASHRLTPFIQRRM